MSVDAGDFDAAMLPQSSSGVGGVWSPFHDAEWWLAALGGSCLFFHYQTLYWAYDTAPSTVINPLLQVSSTWVLLGTAIPAALTGSTFIKPFDLGCYAIIVVGGLLPSLQGDMKAMLRLSFWRQSHVKYAVLSEITLGLYDLLLSFVLKRGRLAEDERLIRMGGPNVLENEFFFLAWCWFVVTFALAYGEYKCIFFPGHSRVECFFFACSASRLTPPAQASTPVCKRNTQGFATFP